MKTEPSAVIVRVRMSFCESNQEKEIKTSLRHQLPAALKNY